MPRKCPIIFSSWICLPSQFGVCNSHKSCKLAQAKFSVWHGKKKQGKHREFEKCNLSGYRDPTPEVSSLFSAMQFLFFTIIDSSYFCYLNNFDMQIWVETMHHYHDYMNIVSRWIWMISTGGPLMLKSGGRVNGIIDFQNVNYLKPNRKWAKNMLGPPDFRLVTYPHCPKLRGYPAPGAPISKTGCMVFRGVHPMHVFSAFYHYVILGACMEKFPAHRLFFFVFFFPHRSNSALHRLSSIEILLDHRATFCAGGLPMSVFLFLAAAGFEPTSWWLPCGRVTATPLWPLGFKRSA